MKRSLHHYGWYLLPLLAAGYLFAQCLYVIISRFSYPYAVEWVEGGMLQPVVRLLDGLPLYTSPSMNYVPALYAPLYFHVAAWFSALTGPGLPALRLVSIMAGLLTAILAATSVFCLSRSRAAALLALLCWGALFRFSGNTYDVGRVDSLWALFLVSAVTALVFFRQQAKPVFLWLAAVCLVLALYTKQTSLMLLPFFCLTVWCWAGFRQAFHFGALLVMLSLAAGVLYQFYSGGWFYFYTMQMAGEHHFNNGIPFNFIYGDILLGVPAYLLSSVFFLVSRWPDKRDALAWALLLCGFMLMSLLSRWYSGGFFNVLIPLHQLLLIMGVAGFAVLVDCRFSSFGKQALRVFILLLFSLNVITGWFNPQWQIPSAQDRQCGDNLVRRLAAAQGDVCVFKHNYLSYLAGKPFCAHEVFAADLLNGSDRQLSAMLANEVRRKLVDGDYKVLLLDNQAQFYSYGIDFQQLPYTATDLDCPADSFYPPISGQRPLHWLQYNGKGMLDLRESAGGQ